MGAVPLLLPGMGATAALHGGLTAVRAVDWPEDPSWRSLGDLAEICIHHFAVQPGDPVGGSSFGGMVAAEMAIRLPGSPLVLIGSALDPGAIPARGLLGIPERLVRPALLAAAARTSPGPLTAMATACGAPFIRRACAALRRWQGVRRRDLGMVHHIHGLWDPVIPAPLVRADRYLAGGGHAIAWSHPAAVDQWIRDRLG
jgi:hypothetical protein